MPTKADLLADLLDGELDPGDAPADLVELAGLAADVRQYVVPLPPSPAFREALREELVHTAGTAGAGAAAAAGGAAASTTGTVAGILPSVVAAVAASVVLVSGGTALTTQSAPGDVLYGLKRGAESVQLAVAGDDRDVDVLAGHALQRLREALDVADVQAVNALLRESEGLLDDAFALAAEQGRDVGDLVARQTGALLTLASRTEDTVVDAHIRQLLTDLGVEAARPTGDPAPSPSAGTDPTGFGGGPAPRPSTPSEPDGPTGGLPDAPVNELPDDPATQLPEGPAGGPPDAPDGGLPDDLVEDLLDDAPAPAEDLLEPPAAEAGDLLGQGGLAG